MKTCHACGAYVPDDALSCPECGATIVKKVSGLSLKPEGPARKKPSHTTGSVVSTGSGLTNILREGQEEYDDYEEDDYGGGSMPYAMSKNQLKEYEESKKHAKHRKSGKGALGTLFKIVLFAAIAFGVYYFFNNVLLKKDGAQTAEDAMDIYVEAVNNNDEEMLLKIIPPYITTNHTEAQNILGALSNPNIASYDILESKEFTKDDVTHLNDAIQMERGKTAKISAARSLRMRLKGTMTNRSGAKTQKFPEVTFDFVQIKGVWYLYTDTYSNKEFGNE